MYSGDEVVTKPTLPRAEREAFIKAITDASSLDEVMAAAERVDRFFAHPIIGDLLEMLMADKIRELHAEKRAPLAMG